MNLDKELEKEIEEDNITQQRKRDGFVDDIFKHGNSLVDEIEIKRLKEIEILEKKKRKTILKKLLDFLIGV